MSESLSDVVSATAPALIGVWVFDPTDADATERNYLHADGRTESIAPRSAVLEVAGRVDPIVEFGEVTIVGLEVTVFVPFGPDHDAGVQWWRDAVEARRAICYRDNRGRLMYGALPAGVSPVDGRAGTAMAIKLQRVTYAPEV